MKIRNIAVFFTAAVIFLFPPTPISSAQSIDAPPHMPGITEGSGKHFEVTDSEYLNVSLDSSANIAVRMESAPEMIVLEIKSSNTSAFSSLVLSGLSPNTTYHKYQDDYHNYAPFTTDGNGAFSFDQDISQNHIIFIQPRKSTRFIKNDSVGGDCANIGNWNASTKTCVLNQDINETIQIDSDNIILDGGGHTINGSNSGSGIYAYYRRNVIIRNVTVSGFYYGIRLDSSNYNKIDSATTKNNRNGIYLSSSNYNTVSNNEITTSISYGLGIISSKNNTTSNNTIGPGNAYGISQENTGNYNIYENNNVFQNGNTGIRTYWSSYITLRNNTVTSNAYDGIVISAGDRVVLSGNVMSGNGFGGANGKSNFSISGGDMSTNNIDESNTVEGKPIYYKKGETNKTYDGSMNIGSFYCINCDSITVKDLALTEHAAKIYFWHTNNSFVEGVSSPDKSTAASLSYSSNNTFSKSTFDYIFIGYQSNNNKIYNNNFTRNSYPANVSSSTGNLFNLELPIGGNYWKANANNCIDANNDEICDSTYIFNGGVDNYPRVKEFDFSRLSCCSSVMFLPGHQASRLYRKDSDGDEDQLWEPTNHNEDVRQLYLNADGESVDSGIYIRDIVDEGYGTRDIYKNFMASMDRIVTDGVINEWKPVPYDWRLPLEKIVDDGVKLENSGHMDIVDEVKRMAASSKTGKVTLIGHSNGGLLAKTLIDKLKESGSENLVDKLIMVGTPQLGTPKAIASLLHGDDTDMLKGLTLDRKTGRSFGENMLSAYNLLPSKKYFDIVQSPVMEFDEDVEEIYDFRSLYGDNIDNWSEFKKFLLGDNGARSEPAESDLDSPNILKKDLLAKAEDMHEKLDDWQAPEGVEIIQIAGWGLDTIRGIEYDDCDIPFCPNRLSNLDRTPIITEDGDHTVVVPSAVEIDENAEKYYVNVNEYNNKKKANNEHANILGVISIQDFIKNIIRNNRNLPDYISTEKPEVKDEDERLRYRLHSPVKLDLYDENGNHTGLVKASDSDPDLLISEEQIPNSYYAEFGEVKYAGSGNYPVNIVLTGEDLGTFTFDIDQVAGDRVSETTTFANIPVMKDAQATLSVSDTVSEMKIDINHDGQTDITLHPGEKITGADLLEIFEKILDMFDIDRTVKDRLINKTDNAKKQVTKGNSVAANAMLENVKQQIETFSREQTPEKFRIQRDEADKLSAIIDRIQMVE